MDKVSRLFLEERHLIERAVKARQMEFSTGRELARELLARLGVHGLPILSGDDRSPIWPEGIVGSISHTRTLCTVAVALRSDVLAIGIDLEHDESIGPELWRSICAREELFWIGQRPAEEQGALVRLIFSAKECVYKCQYPETRVPLEFHDVRVTLDLERGRFSAELSKDAPPIAATGDRLQGVFARSDGHLCTGMVIPARPAGKIRSKRPLSLPCGPKSWSGP
ncbi:MAG: 4'-phosphopantetheinyl transferase superfamily protein [Deltaproteobacteria bacterium]|nr:4'-phosphopantetheinyl transferase superfamily protein [Deltaproteobacteria bacterium]